MDDTERHPVYVNELERDMLTIGLELVNVHLLYPDYVQVRQDLLNRMRGLTVL